MIEQAEFQKPNR